MQLNFGFIPYLFIAVVVYFIVDFIFKPKKRPSRIFKDHQVIPMPEDNPKEIFKDEVCRDPEIAPLSARWMAASWSAI
jgi:hypothetical protein